ncbi:MAG TPA: acyl-CoA dehydrogenase family protein [Chloroflexota bacterium]|jgi:alkylation response protein AidB-like acyl-CoA dehydrogenase
MPEAASHSAGATAAQCATLLEAAAVLRPVIRGYQAEIESERRIPLALVAQLRAVGLYRLFVPRALGGAQVDVLTFLRAVELAAEGDGSVAWNLGTNAIAGSAALSLPDAGVREIFGDGPDVIFAGTIAPLGGTAVPVDGGYRCTGRWRFGSGCQEADWLVGSCQVREGDEPRRNPDGSPEVRRVLVRPADCTIHDTWDVTGLRGTGSHDWSVADLFVPEHRTQNFTARWTHWSGTLYALPLHAFQGPHFSPVATGIARAGLDALAELAGSKNPRQSPGLLRDDLQAQDWLGRAEALLGAAQAYRAAVTADVWATVAAGQPATAAQQARCRLAASFAVDSAIQAMDLAYRAGGSTSIERDHPLARCWRDVHAVAQNVVVGPEYYALAGRALLGLDPGPKLGMQPVVGPSHRPV